MTTNLPPEAVEAAARALYEAVETARGSLTWDELAEGHRQKPYPDYPHLYDAYVQRARAALSAALPLLPDVGDLLAELDRLRSAMVMPDRDTITRAHVPVDTAFPNPWGCACGKSFRTGQQWSGHVIDEVLAVLPGRTDAQVGAQYLREAADYLDHDRGGNSAGYKLRIRAHRIERGEQP